MVEIHRYIKSTLLTRKPLQSNTTIGVIAVGVITLFSVIYWSSFLGLEPFLAATRHQVFVEKEYWRLFTAVLVHADPQHLLSNALGFFLFGYLLYDYFGAGVFPAASYALGIIVHAIALKTYGPDVRLVGASGMVYVMVAIWVTLYLFIERRHTYGKRLMRGIGFTLAVLMPSTFEQAVSYRTHAIGFAVGIAFGLIVFALRHKQFRAKEVWATEVIEPLEPMEPEIRRGPTFH